MRDTTLARTRGYGWKAAEWLMGVFGGVAAFLGFFIMFGPEEDYVGLGGDVAWQVGDVSSAWMYGLVIGGLVLLAGALLMVIAGRSRTRVAPTPRGDLLWHVGVFVLVNAFVWAQDFALGSGLDYAYLVTIPWLFGLAVHGFSLLSKRGRVSAEGSHDYGRWLGEPRAWPTEGWYSSRERDAETVPEAELPEQEQKELQHH